jgi:hypothetical protein
MSDVAVVETVVNEASPPAAESSAPEVTKPSGTPDELRRSLRKEVRSMGKSERTPGAVDERGRIHATEDGTFLPGKADTAAESAATETVAETSPAVPEQPTASDGLPAGHVRHEFPADFPVRSVAGTTQVVPEAVADAVRWAANNHTRRNEVEAARQQAEQSAIQARAEAQAYQEAAFSLLADPSVALRFQEIKAWDDQNGTQEANRWLKGLVAEMQEGVSAKVNDATTQYTEQYAEHEARQNGQAFMDTTRSLAMERCERALPGWSQSPAFEQTLKKAWFAYGAELEAERKMGNSVQSSPDGLWRHFDALFVSAEDVRSHFRQREADAEAKRMADIRAQFDAEQKAAEAARLRDATNRRNTLNPIAAIPSAVQTGATTHGPATVDMTGWTADQIRRHLRRAS